MPEFIYKAKSSPGMFKTGVIEAENERAAVSKLRQMELFPVFVRVQGKAVSRRFLKSAAGSGEVYIFFRQISNLLEAGLPLIRALTNISSQNSNSRLKPVVEDLRERIQRGDCLSDALSVHKRVFGSMEINMVRAAETSGTLPEALTKLADLKENELSFSAKIRSALAYPILLSIVGALTLFILITFVLPRFIVLFEDFGQSLPLLTRGLIALSSFSGKFWPVLLLSGFAAFIFVSRFFRTETGRLKIDRWRLKLPLIREIDTRLQSSRFARTLGTLLENGVPVLNSLHIVVDVLTNRAFAEDIRRLHGEVSRGRQISDVLRESGLFERSTLDLIAVGEESGRLEDMLFRVARMNEAEAARRIETVLFMLEPALILGLGLVVGLIVMAILLPIFQMNFLIQ